MSEYLPAISLRSVIASGSTSVTGRFASVDERRGQQRAGRHVGRRDIHRAHLRGGRLRAHRADVVQQQHSGADRQQQADDERDAASVFHGVNLRAGTSAENA